MDKPSNSGTLNLKPLYELAAKLGPQGLLGRSTEGREYGKAVKESTSIIPTTQGIYIWGYYQSNKLWRTVYLGKAGFGGSSNLNLRIDEELRDERPFLWVGKQTRMSLDEVKLEWLRLGGKNGIHTKAAVNHVDRALRKDKTTHIHWVAMPETDNHSILKIEADLVEVMNPIANVHRPAPSHDISATAIDVLKEFRALINNNR